MNLRVTKNRCVRGRMLSLCALGLATAFAVPRAHAINSERIHEHVDASGLVTIAVFERTAGDEQQHFHDFAVEVSGDFVARAGYSCHSSHYSATAHR